MTVIELLIAPLVAVKDRIQRYRLRRRWSIMCNLGMRIGDRVDLPASTWIDSAHCYLIDIGDDCRFGEQCLILSHDAQMDEFLDAGRLGHVTIHERCQIGARCTIMAGVEIGPNTIVAPGSVVLRSLPGDSICGGNPARPLSSVDEYLSAQRAEMERQPHFDAKAYKRMQATADGRTELAALLVSGKGYVMPSGDGGGTEPTNVANPR